MSSPLEIAIQAYQSRKNVWTEITEARYWEMENSFPVAAKDGTWFLQGKTQSYTPENESLFFGCKFVPAPYGEDRFYVRLMTIHDFFYLRNNQL